MQGGVKFVLATCDSKTADYPGRPTQDSQQLLVRCPELDDVINGDDLTTVAPGLLRKLYDIAEQLQEAAEDL